MFLQSNCLPQRPQINWLLVTCVLLGITLLLISFSTFASSGTGGGLPYESALTKLRNSVTGPVAFAISVIGIVVGASMLIWGSELNAFFKSMIMIVLVVSIIVGSNNLLSNLFGTGATITMVEDKIETS
jgi:type IV secretion system protein VirB2